MNRTPEAERQAQRQHYLHILGLGPDATPREIKRAGRAKAMEHHPDRGGDEELFKKFNEAYQWLLDEEKEANRAKLRGEEAAPDAAAYQEAREAQREPQEKRAYTEDDIFSHARYKKGTRVVIARSSGELEEGWVITGVREGHYIVSKGELWKETPFNELEEFQKYYNKELHEKPQLKVGQIVNVLRSSGELEKGIWKIEAIKNGEYVVAAPAEDEGFMVKEIEFERLERVQNMR